MVRGMPADIENPERHLLLRETGQLRTDIANVESSLEIIMPQIAGVRRELTGRAVWFALALCALGLINIATLWRVL